MTPPLPGDVPVNFRVPRDILDRADALSERLAVDPRAAALVGTKPSRSAVLRLTIVRGLEVLEAEHLEAPPTP